MHHVTINADSATPSLVNASTGATPVIFAGAGLAIDIFLLNEGEPDISSNIDELILEIKPVRSDRPGGIPDVGDPILLRKRLASVQAEDMLSNVASGYNVQFLLTAEETLLGLWDKVFVSVYGTIDETVTIWAAGFAQVKKLISLPGVVDPLLALDRHHAMIKIESGSAIIYYWDAATGNLETATILAEGLVGPEAITGLSEAGNLFYVGTNAAGAPGIYSLGAFMLSASFTGDGTTPVNLATAIAGSPGAKFYYGTNAAGTKGFHSLQPTKVLASAAIATHTDSSTWTQKINSTASIVSGQMYKITISYGWNHDSETARFVARATIGGVAISAESTVIHMQEPKDAATAGLDVTGSGTDQRHHFTGVYLWTAAATNTTAAVILEFSTTTNSIKSTMWDAVFIIEAI